MFTNCSLFFCCCSRALWQRSYINHKSASFDTKKTITLICYEWWRGCGANIFHLLSNILYTTCHLTYAGFKMKVVVGVAVNIGQWYKVEINTSTLFILDIYRARIDGFFDVRYALISVVADHVLFWAIEFPLMPIDHHILYFCCCWSCYSISLQS